MSGIETPGSGPSCEHTVTFYDGEGLPTTAVADAVAAALGRGDTVLLIASPRHRGAFETVLRARGLDVAGARASGALVEADAHQMLASFRTHGLLDPRRFAEVTGVLLEELVAGDRSLVVYSDMAALLWEEGDVGGALWLESRSNELLASHPFGLHCAYPSGVAGADPGTLRTIRRHHDRVLGEQAAAPASTGGVRGQGAARILVVDDEPSVATTFALALERAGFEVLSAASGQGAVELALEERPDVVLLDLHLPDVSGQEVLDRLRADPRTEGAIVLVVTGDGELHRRLEGLRSGANDFLTKPVALQELVARIEGQLTARDRWQGQLSDAMQVRLRLARRLVGIDPGSPLPAVLVALRETLGSELGVDDLALSLLSGGSVVSTIDGHGREDVTAIAGQAHLALVAPWIERAAGRQVVHVAMQNADVPFAVLSTACTGRPEPVLATLVDLASQLSSLLLPGVDATTSIADDRATVARMLEPDGMWPVFQPVVDLASGATVGYEGLSRFANGMRPDLAFELATRLGSGPLLEVEAARRVLAAAQHLPPDVWVALNFSAATILSVDLAPVVRDSPRPLVIEITEHELVTDYAAVIEAIAALDGARLSVDDAGSGYASLRHVYELRPSIVKLDRAWVAEIDTDPIRQALIRGLLSFTGATGALLVAEGVEREVEAEVLRSLGVPLAQGYLFGRPALLTPQAALSV